MSTGIAAAQTFQEKMFARIKDQMGDLLTEIEMKALVDKAMEEAFFKVRETKDSYGHVRDNQMYFDYLHGRVMKISLRGDELQTALYNRDNGAGAAERIIESLRSTVKQ